MRKAKMIQLKKKENAAKIKAAKKLAKKTRRIENKKRRETELLNVA